MFIFQFTNTAVSYTVKCGSSLPKWIGAASTTIGSTVRVASKYCPDAQSLAHEYFHVVHTNWIHYLFSCTIGKLWGDKYWKNEELTANIYGGLHQKDPIFVEQADQIRSVLPADWRTVTIQHNV